MTSVIPLHNRVPATPGEGVAINCAGHTEEYDGHVSTGKSMVRTDTAIVSKLG